MNCKTGDLEIILYDVWADFCDVWAVWVEFCDVWALWAEFCDVWAVL